MYTIVGLGSVGHNIVNKFLQYPQYNGYTIDWELPEDIGNSRFIELDECDHPEKYEEAVPDLSRSTCPEGSTTLRVKPCLYCLVHQLFLVLHLESWNIFTRKQKSISCTSSQTWIRYLS